MDITDPTTAEAITLLGLIALITIVAFVFARNRRREEELALDGRDRRVGSQRLRDLRGADELERLERQRVDAEEREVKAHHERVRIEAEIRDEAARLRATADVLDASGADGEAGDARDGDARDGDDAADIDLRERQRAMDGAEHRHDRRDRVHARRE